MASIDETLLAQICDMVCADQADRIVPLLYNPNLTPEDNQAQNRWIHEDTSFDLGFIWDRRYLNLLHFAAMNAAENCIKLLLSPPYSWDPDRVDGDGHSPMHYLVKANMPSVFHWLLQRAHNLCEPYWAKMKPFHWLIWPQSMDVSIEPLSFKLPLIKSLNRCVFPWQFGHQRQLECRVPFALLLELCVSIKADWNFWTAAWPLDLDRWFWPIPKPKPVKIPYHSEQCTDYPQCLDQLIVCNQTGLRTGESCDVLYRLLLSVWAFHTLTEPVTEQGITHHVTRPPALKRSCRFVIRRILIGKYDEEATSSSTPIYPWLIKKLPISEDLQNYLMYSELWPTYIDIQRPSMELVEARADSVGNVLFQGEEPFGFLLE